MARFSIRFEIYLFSRPLASIAKPLENRGGGQMFR